jgi:hypothetical protein
MRIITSASQEQQEQQHSIHSSKEFLAAAYDGVQQA